MTVTQEQVAVKAGVSRSAVSLVINDKHENHISEEMRTSILKAAEELGYQRHAIGRSLVENKAYTVGLALYSFDYIKLGYFAAIISGMEQVLGLKDYNLQVCITDKQPIKERQNLYFMKKVRSLCVDGLIIVDQSIEDKEILELKNMGVPFVLVDREIPGEDLNCVLVDNTTGIFKATEHFIKSGHKRIGLVLETLKFYKDREMLKGYKIALDRYGLDYDENLLKETKSPLEAGKVVDSLLELSSPPTALLFTADKVAIHSYKTIKDRGLRIPEDIALIGYDDEEFDTIMEPPLSSVHVPLSELGEIATDMLLGIIEGELVEPRRKILSPMLIIRGSS